MTGFRPIVLATLAVGLMTAHGHAASPSGPIPVPRQRPAIKAVKNEQDDDGEVCVAQGCRSVITNSRRAGADCAATAAAFPCEPVHPSPPRRPLRHRRSI